MSCLLPLSPLLGLANEAARLHRAQRHATLRACADRRCARPRERRGLFESRLLVRFRCAKPLPPRRPVAAFCFRQHRRAHRRDALGLHQGQVAEDRPRIRAQVRGGRCACMGV